MTIAVIFDLDGLLVDTELISYKIYKEILADIGCEFSLEDYAKNLSGKTIALNVKYLIDNYRIPWTPEFGFSRIVEIEHGFIIQGVELKPGARELISWLKKNDYKIAMASSSIEERALNILRHHDLVDSFDELVFGYEVKRGKPAPDIFLRACKKLSEKPEDCLVLEDGEAGIQVPFSANIPVICIPDMKVPNQRYLEMTSATLPSLDQVITYLTNSSETWLR